ncbi:MAG: VWA domain-containing protein [Acidobacteria bacterium]|nr:VWA domain-containing protein [Acidobacteriota bacterium]
MSASGRGFARRTLRRYVDTVTGQNDQAAVVSASGQLGFLQQLTDDKAVLRAALARLNFSPPSSALTGRPPITAYQAIAVQERNDSRILEYLVDETVRTTPGIPRSVAESLVQSRTRVIAQDAAFATKATLSALENLLRSSARLPGRKIVFFFSEGFLSQMQNTDEAEQLRRITDAAARSGAVVYAVDTRGLATDPYFDASRGTPVDPTGRGMIAAHSAAELRAQQDPLRTISEETGGRAVVNTNDLDAGVARALDESSRYYLLAWRPERDENRGGKFRRVGVAIAGRPDLSVRLHKGYFAPVPKPAPKGAKPAAPQDELRAELSAIFPNRQLPVALAVNFVDLPERGAVLTASAAVPSYPLAFKPANGTRTAAVDVACVVFDERGKAAANAQERIIVSVGGEADAADAGLRQCDVAYNFQFNQLPPGLYQVCAAARDVESGRVGGASRWIEIPDLRKRKLALSSLLVGRLPGGAQGAAAGAGPPRLDFDANHRFTRDARMGLYTYIYNASRG